jgi:hypothetical protein
MGARWPAQQGAGHSAREIPMMQPLLSGGAARWAGAAVLAAAVLTPLPAAAAPLAVTSTADTGAGSLRAAIQFANANPGTTIQFKIPALPPGAEVVTIRPLSALPAITGAGTVLDGTTQTALTGNTNPAGPEVVLNGGLAGAASGLVVTTGGVWIKSLVINGFTGTGVRFLGAAVTGCKVTGCYLGTDEVGTFAVPNGARGVEIGLGATSNTIGGAAAAEANVISGNTAGGVLIHGAGTENNQVLGCLIGTDPSGTAALPNGEGVRLQAGAKLNVIGGTGGARNLLSGNLTFGVRLIGPGTEGNIVRGNRIGTNLNGNAKLPNGLGGVNIAGGTTGNLIGGTLSERNIISGNLGPGVQLAGALTANTISGNYIGTNLQGTAALGNSGVGILVQAGAKDNTIGAPGTGSRNVISGNGSHGIEITGSGTDGNKVHGNYIGTDVAGSAAVPNGWAGIRVAGGAKNTVIGGDFAGSKNVISGHPNAGIQVLHAGTNNTAIQGNYIGTNAGGVAAIGNQWGILVEGGPTGCLIGGGSAAGYTRNVISGNWSFGLIITGSDGNFVQGNRVGTNAGGSAAVPNLAGGVAIGGNNNLVGGATDLLGNQISGNELYGLGISGNGHQVQRNRIGTNASGTVAVPNGGSGILVYSGTSTIGGAGLGNQVSGNRTHGIHIDGTLPLENLILGNFIGTNPAGTAALPNEQDGIRVERSRGNRIGGATPEERNLISGNRGHGISLAFLGADYNLVWGNYIGVSVTGAAALPNGKSGVLMQGSGGSGPNYCQVGGIGGKRNIISGNAQDGIGFTPRGSNNNELTGNFIGVNALGTAALPNGRFGIAFWTFGLGNAYNVIAANVIAGNARGGIMVGPIGSGHQFLGNLIGTDATGLAPLPNGGPGIWFRGADGHFIGGTLAESRNIISGNLGDGILMEEGSQNNLVRGNFIGLDANGVFAVPNGGNGIVARDDADNNRLGQPLAGGGNVIAGNAGSAIVIGGPDTTGCTVEGNLIGLAADGTAQRGNGGDGVRLEQGVSLSRVGGTNLYAINRICYSAGDGVQLRDAATHSNQVQGNRIGVNASGEAAPNGGNGVQIRLNSHSNVVGGGAGGATNVIAYNPGDGILVRDAGSTGNLFRRNSLFANGGLGINLQASGAFSVVTPNDDGDLDTGPNGLQNFPVLTNITVSAASTALTLECQGFRPNRQYLLEVFRDGTDPSGFGEGQTYVGAKAVTTNASGFASTTLVLAEALPGVSFSATAADTLQAETSEFGPVATAPPR